MQFNEQMKNEAIEAINKLMTHPISTPFHQPYVSNGAPPDYLEKIKKPSDLSTVKSKILNGEITTTQQWFDEMELIWSNAEIYFGKDSTIGLIAGHNRLLFNKEKKILFGQTTRQWCESVYDLRTKITDIMNQLPSKVKQFTDTLGAARSMKTSQQVMNERELQNFLKATELMTSDEDQNQLIQIIATNQPELDTGSTDLQIDPLKLNRNTIQKLKEYMKQSLEKQGKKYPETM